MLQAIKGLFVTSLFGMCVLACGTTGPDPQPSGACSSDADCRTFSDYCTGCDCRALTSSEPEPVCQGPGVRCFADPCGGQQATCRNQRCVVGAPEAPSSCAVILCPVGTVCVVENGRAGCR